MEDEEIKKEMYNINDVSKLENPSEIMRFMVMFFKIYDDQYFDIFKSHSMEQVHSFLDMFDVFMRKSMVKIPYRSELSKTLKTKEMCLIEAIVKNHSKLVNFHLGYTSLIAIDNMSPEHKSKLENIREEATDTHHLLKNLADSIKKEMPKLSGEKVFFTKEEYENYETKAKLPTASRRERRAKKHGH